MTETGVFYCIFTCIQKNYTVDWYELCKEARFTFDIAKKMIQATEKFVANTNGGPVDPHHLRQQLPADVSLPSLLNSSRIVMSVIGRKICKFFLLLVLRVLHPSRRPASPTSIQFHGSEAIVFVLESKHNHLLPSLLKHSPITASDYR